MAIFKSGLAMVAVLATGVAYGVSRSGPDGLAPETFKSENSYRVVLEGRDTGCDLTIGDGLSGDKAALAFGRQCADELPALAGARYWREGEDGDIALIGADGVVAMKFAAGDGIAYESFGAGAPLVSLVSLGK